MLLVYALWAVFVNAVNIWIITPLVLDYAAIGLAALVVLVLVWIFSIPRASRRRWIGFTLFSLILGSGFGEVIQQRSLSLRSVLMVVMVIGLVLLARFLTRVRMLRLWVSAVVLVLANVWLPVQQWSFLTHFAVAYHNNFPMQQSDFPTLPFEVVNTGSGQALVTLSNLTETPATLKQDLAQPFNSDITLEDVLRNYKHRYELMSLAESHQSFTLNPAPLSMVPYIDPFLLTNTFFPSIRAHWVVDNNRIVQFMSPTQSPETLTQMAMDPADWNANFVALAEQTATLERKNWNKLSDAAGAAQSGAGYTNQGFSVVNGWLVGQWNGQSVRIPVAGNDVVGTGSFTKADTKQVLVSGPNLLQVVDLTTGKVVSEYHGDAVQPLSSDIVTGPIDNSGRDVIFVNSSPAQILGARTSNQWDVLYTATNPSLRFEASMQWVPGQAPEILTDDPSLVRNSPTRYFSSYTYRNGELVRNWRVYHTNVVNVHPVQFVKNGVQYIACSIYGTGEMFVLRRHHIPVVPMTSGILGVAIVIGYVRRVSSRGGKANEATRNA